MFNFYLVYKNNYTSMLRDFKILLLLFDFNDLKLFKFSIIFWKLTPSLNILGIGTSLFVLLLNK